VNLVSVWNEARSTRVAVLALSDGGAFVSIIVTSSCIDGAGFVSDGVVVHILIGRYGFTSVTSIIIHAARDNNLRSNVDIRPGSISLDLNPVGEG
jgi:hypothetical protein